MSMMRLFNLSVKIAAWATPHLQRWMRSQQLNEEHAERHFQARNYAEAEKFYAAAIDDAERRHSALKKRIPLMLQLAESSRRNGDLDAALVAVSDAIEKTGRAGALYGQCLDALSAIQIDRGETAAALDAGRAALEIAREQRSEPAVIAERCYRLAAVEQRCGNADRQKALLEESIGLYEKAYGAEHVQTANRLTDMGVALRNEGSFTEALVFLEKACSAHQKLVGTDAPEYVTDVEHLAATQQALGNLAEAARLYDRLLRLKENQLGLDPVEYGHLLLNAAETYTAADLDARAYETVQHAIRMLDRKGGALGDVADRIIVVLDAVGRPGDVEAFRKRVEAFAAKPA